MKKTSQLAMHAAMTMMLAMPLVCRAVDTDTATDKQLANAPHESARPASLGPSSATVNLVAFMDFECPFSNDLYFELEKYEALYPGQIRLTVKQLPLPVHPGSEFAHEAALAAGAQGKYFEMARLIFANQGDLKRSSLETLARQLNLDIPLFKDALDHHTYAAAVQQDASEARAFGVTATPTLFLNGSRLDGFQTIDILKQKTDSLLLAGKPKQPALPAETSQPPNTVADALPARLTAQIEAADAQYRGSSNAPVTVVEFSDFQCPFCRKNVPVLQELMVQRPGVVRLVYRSFPLSFHKDSELANEAALAAGAQGNFWEMHDLIFANQSAIKRDDLINYAKQLQLNQTTFLQALDEHVYAGQIAADRALGTEADVDGTPTVFINGRRLTGARSTAELLQVIDQEAAIAKSGGTHRGPVVLATIPAGDTENAVLGEPAAPVHIAWYTDVRGALSQRQASLLHELSDAYPGQVSVVFKAVRLPNHPDSELAARALLAASAQHGFWPMFEAIAAYPQPLSRDAVLKMATQQHLSPKAFVEALDAPQTTSTLEADLSEQRRRAISGSPVLLIQKQRVDGIQPAAYYHAIIDSEIHATARSTPSAVGPALIGGAAER